jgi:hypothetical protein
LCGVICRLTNGISNCSLCLAVNSSNAFFIFLIFDISFFGNPSICCSNSKSTKSALVKVQYISSNSIPLPLNVFTTELNSFNVNCSRPSVILFKASFNISCSVSWLGGDGGGSVKSCNSISPLSFLIFY